MGYIINGLKIKEGVNGENALFCCFDIDEIDDCNYNNQWDYIDTIFRYKGKDYRCGVDLLITYGDKHIKEYPLFISSQLSNLCMQYIIKDKDELKSLVEDIIPYCILKNYDFFNKYSLAFTLKFSDEISMKKFLFLYKI